DISEISDSGSGSGSGEEYEDNQPAKKARKKHHWGPKQEEQVEAILKKKHRVHLKTTPKADKKPSAKGTKATDKTKKILPDSVKEYLKAWMMSPEHCDHPYPTAEEKAVIIADTGMSFTELNNWFVNNRKRFWLQVVKPKINDIKKAHRMKELKESYNAVAFGEIYTATKRDTVNNSA
ncbi:hypothetical protein ACHAXR_003046, partial [Thalassiosira sp. AJA248-18]